MAVANDDEYVGTPYGDLLIRLYNFRMGLSKSYINALIEIPAAHPIVNGEDKSLK